MLSGILKIRDRWLKISALLAYVVWLRIKERRQIDFTMAKLPCPPMLTGLYAVFWGWGQCRSGVAWVEWWCRKT